MRRFVRYTLPFIVLSLSGCALFNYQAEQRQVVPQKQELQEDREAIPPEPPKPPHEILTGKCNGRNRTDKLCKADATAYYPLLNSRGYEERGLASWYGPSFHGRTTSCGEIFDMYKISAAHKLLPMHTKVHVTNLENGKSITLAVNDRGPFIPGRVLDLSYAAAKSLGIVDKGLARVIVRTSGPIEGQKNSNVIGDFFVHIGSFEAEEAALWLLEDMKSLKYRRSILKVIRAERDGEIHWRVALGPYRSLSDAHRAHSKVVRDYPSAFVVARQ